AGIQHHKIPKSSLDVEYSFNLSVVVEGALASAAIASPTHAIAFKRLPNRIAAKLSGRAVMDRDFVLTLESETAQSSCIQTPDGEEHVAVASLRIPPLETNEAQPLALKVLIDCSGSMGGTSIAQARKATLEILNALRPTDSFNVTLFGSECKHLFPRLMPASGKYITEAWNHLEHLDADMGGTEMEAALASTFALTGSESSPCVLVITDGEIEEHEKLVRRASSSAHRVFTVGVGTAVVDAFLQSLAQTTGGACELVSPQEGMAEKILAQFHRLRQPKLESIEIDWPTTPEWTTPLPLTFFAGDTVHVFAGFKHAIGGVVTLRTSIAGKPINFSAPVALTTEPELPRIAAAKRITDANTELALALSLKYQLISKMTNYLVIAERDAKAGELPDLHQIPQMLAAGWGSTSDVSGVLACRKGGGASFDDMYDDNPFDGDPMLRASASKKLGSVSYSMGNNDIPAFISRSGQRPYQSPPQLPTETMGSDASEKTSSPHPINKINSPTPTELIARLSSAFPLFLRSPSLPKTIKALQDFGMPSRYAPGLHLLIKLKNSEEVVVIAYLYALSESKIGNLFERSLKRAILKAWKDASPFELINEYMRELTKNIDANSWGPYAEIKIADLLPPEVMAYKKGTRVKHQKTDLNWGEGIVLEDSYVGRSVKIKFSNSGVKQLAGSRLIVIDQS
ncbi:MAG: VWA domain-containing protein, partial [Betaproteobacteria bacterium]